MKLPIEKLVSTIVPVLIVAEGILSIYLLYLMVGLVIPIVFVAVMAIATFAIVWFLSKYCETADIFKEPEKYAVQSKIAEANFYRALSISVFFPLRAIIIYFVYINFDDGVLYILLYLLFTSQRMSADLVITGKVADELYFKKSN